MDSETEVKLFREGMKAGIWLFATWKDGQQLVGANQIPLKEAWLKVDKGEYDVVLNVHRKVSETLKLGKDGRC